MHGVVAVGMLSCICYESHGNRKGLNVSATISCTSCHFVFSCTRRVCFAGSRGFAAMNLTVLVPVATFTINRSRLLCSIFCRALFCCGLLSGFCFRRLNRIKMCEQLKHFPEARNKKHEHVAHLYYASDIKSLRMSATTFNRGKQGLS